MRRALAREPDNGTLPFDLDSLVARVAERVAEIVTERLLEHFEAPQEDRWLNSQQAADYLALPSVNALYKLIAEHRLPSAQDEPGGRHYFTRADLDAWRRGSDHG